MAFFIRLLLYWCFFHSIYSLTPSPAIASNSSLSWDFNFFVYSTIIYMNNAILTKKKTISWKKKNCNRFVSLMNCFRFDALFPCHCVLIFFVSLDAILLKAPLDPHELFHLISKSIHNRRIASKWKWKGKKSIWFD